LLVALSVAGATGCAAVTLTRGPDPRAQLVAGAAAVEAQDYARARTLLEPLYFERWMEPVGQEAMLVLIAAELDGRNPDRRLWAAADMSGRLLGIPQLEPWMVPVAESYYVLADELGASEARLALGASSPADAEARAARADVTGGSGRAVPVAARESVPSRINRLTAERDSLKRMIEEREQQIATRDRELRDTKQELERIKKTIKS
jgi:hypothetical protein